MSNEGFFPFEGEEREKERKGEKRFIQNQYSKYLGDKSVSHMIFKRVK
jgi:hypothetical protein